MVLNQRDKLGGVNQGPLQSLQPPTKRYDVKECATCGVYSVKDAAGSKKETLDLNFLFLDQFYRHPTLLKPNYSGKRK